MAAGQQSHLKKKMSFMYNSHLYVGFRFAGALSSIHTQRLNQAQILKRIRPQNLLIVGCAHGDELETLIAENCHLLGKLTVTAIDIASVEKEVCSNYYAQKLAKRFQFKQIDLLNTFELEQYGHYDAVQCGFVLHDIEYEKKEQALLMLSRAVKPGGYVMISDIFLLSEQDTSFEVERIYDGFLLEANCALQDGFLRKGEWKLLVGDGIEPGLSRTKKQACAGERDFFQTCHHLVFQAEKVGLELQEIVANPYHAWLRVILLRRSKGVRPSSNN